MCVCVVLFPFHRRVDRVRENCASFETAIEECAVMWRIFNMLMRSNDIIPGRVKRDSFEWGMMSLYTYKPCIRNEYDGNGKVSAVPTIQQNENT